MATGRKHINFNGDDGPDETATGDNSPGRKLNAAGIDQAKVGYELHDVVSEEDRRFGVRERQGLSRPSRQYHRPFR